MSTLEKKFGLFLVAQGLPAPVREYRFCPSRKFRFDFAWPLEKVAVEIEGGSWVYGRHTRGAGFKNDCEKYNLAALEGWKVLRFTSDMISHEAVEAVKLLLNIHSPQKEGS